MNILGKKLKELRKQKKLSLEKLGSLTKTSKSYIWELENAPQANPTADKLYLLSLALDVTIDFLIAPLDHLSDEIKQKAFFRKFRRLRDVDKKRVEQIIDNWLKD